MTPLMDVRVTRHIVDAAFTVPQGTGVVVLFGPSGSGKTTVLRALAGLEPLDEGQITFAGSVWNDGARTVVPARRRRIGYLSQDHALFPHLSVSANVAYGLRRVPRALRAERIDEALTSARAGHLRDRQVRQLSGGEAQRVALARALAPRPDLLLLDEPLSALDAATRASLRGELARVLREQGIPTVLVTHDRSEALALGDAVVLLVDGSVRQVGPTRTVFDRPTDPAVAAVVGVETTQAARIVAVRDGVAELEVGPVRLTAAVPDGEDFAAGDGVLACIRAEDVSIQLGEPDPTSSARNHVPATVTSVVDEGPLVRVDLDATFPLVAYITRPAREDLALSPGTAVIATFKGQAVHLIPRP